MVGPTHHSVIATEDLKHFSYDEVQVIFLNYASIHEIDFGVTETIAF